MRTRIVLLAAGALLAGAPQAEAICRAHTELQATIRAAAVFEAVAQAGPAEAGGVLTAPARFAVSKYVKGGGPRDVLVETAFTPGSQSGAVGVIEDGIRPHAGERWRIFSTGMRDGVVQTSVCAGSYLVGGTKPFTGPTSSGDWFRSALVFSLLAWAVAGGVWAFRRSRGR